VSEPLFLAKQIAKDHHLFIAQVQEPSGPAWVVYRKAAFEGGRPLRLGRRSNPDELLRYVKQLAGVEAAAPKT
jgi:hypothetical protein